MSKKIDITGNRYGKLLAIKETEKRSKPRKCNPIGAILWECICDYGNCLNHKIPLEYIIHNNFIINVEYGNTDFNIIINLYKNNRIYYHLYEDSFVNDLPLYFIDKFILNNDPEGSLATLKTYLIFE